MLRTNIGAIDRVRGDLVAKANILVPPFLLRGDLLAAWLHQRLTGREPRASELAFVSALIQLF